MNGALSLNHNPNMKASAGSLALHALVAAWLLSSAMPIDIMPKQMIQVTLVAAPSSEVNEPKTTNDSPTETKPEVSVSETVTPAPTAPKPEKALRKADKKPAAPARKPKELASLSPSAGHTPTAKDAAQTVSTAPVFDADYLRNPAPTYPAAAKRRNMQGSVMLSVVVTSDGSAKAVTIAQSSGFDILDASALQTVSRWKFVPARRGDETLEARVMVPIEFKLE